MDKNNNEYCNNIFPRWVNEEKTATSLFRNLHTLVDNYLKTFENKYYYKFSYNAKDDWLLKIDLKMSALLPNMIYCGNKKEEITMKDFYAFYFNKSCFDYSFFNYTIITKHTESNDFKENKIILEHVVHKNCESLSKIINIYAADNDKHPFRAVYSTGWHEYCANNIKNLLDKDLTGYIGHEIAGIDIVFDI